ncbi:MAG: hypothetical protein H6618_04815 [Deltaproteobacteria bacterium]|nr:hypothetical protein [Deltaproteobacteria bacterium]
MPENTEKIRAAENTPPKADALLSKRQPSPQKQDKKATAKASYPPEQDLSELSRQERQLQHYQDFARQIRKELQEQCPFISYPIHWFYPGPRSEGHTKL